MNTKQIGNAVEIDGVDLKNDLECLEIGKTLADECVVLIRQSVSEKRLSDIHGLWGQPTKAILHRYVSERKLTGRHWRSLLVSMGQVSNAVGDVAGKAGMSRVSYEKNKKGKPTGVFTNGELDFHSDQQAYHDNPRVVGLMSLWGSKNSQTSFLCTAKAYEKLNHDDKTMVDELYSVWEWDGGTMSKDLIASQKEIVHYNMVPYPQMVCALRDQTASGVKGLKFPNHCFSHFRGMSKKDSLKYRAHLWSLLHKPEYIYTHDWEDGEMIFMDQNITLHARPTNVKDGSRRTMSRMISYMDNLFPGQGPADHMMFGGEKLDHDTFAQMVDEQRREEFYADRKAG